MNRFILACLAATVLVAIHVQWSEAGFLEDFVKFPSLRAKRAMETEEFFKDGDMKGAKIRALNRQRRSNEENMSDSMKRYRRNIMEEDEDEGEFNCRAHEFDDMKRSTQEFQTRPYKYKIDDKYPCSDETLDRFYLMMEFITDNSECTFEYGPVDYDDEDYDIYLGCEAGQGNFAPVGPVGTFKRVNVEQPNGKAAKAIVCHELLHVCGIYHSQQEPWADKVMEINFNCILDGYASQFTEKSVPYEMDPRGRDTSLCSVMEYPSTAFLKLGCTTNIVSKSGSCLSTSIFASNKELYFHETKKIRKARGVECPGELENDEAFGGRCSIVAFHPNENVEAVLLKKSIQWDETTTHKICSPDVVAFECEGNNFQILQSEWNDLNPSSRCRKGAGRIIGLRPDIVENICFVCNNYGDMADPVIHDLEPGTKVFIDTSQVTSGGCMTVEFSCT